MNILYSTSHIMHNKYSSLHHLSSNGYQSIILIVTFIYIRKEKIMPIFEYTCKKCGESFEELVRSDTVVACPKCGSKKVEKELSVFSANSSSNGGGDMPSCFTGGAGCDMGKCGSGCCGME